VNEPVTTTPTAWAMTLPAPAAELAAGQEGCAVAGAGFVALVRGTGELRWSVPTEPGLRRGLAVLPDGGVADVEGDHVVVRRTGGEVAARWDGRGVTSLATVPDGDLVHVLWSRDEGSSLVKVASDGTRRGTVPLAGRTFHPPLVTRDRYVVVEGGRVRGLDHAGRTQWTATRRELSRGFPSAPATGAVREPVLALGDGRFAVEFAEDVGFAFHLVDPATGTVARLAPATAPRSPAAALSDRVVALGPGRHSVVSFAPNGEVAWTHVFPLRPAALLAGSGGQVVVVGEPDRERVRRQADTTLWCLAPDGTPSWSWQPPGPLTATPAVSGDILYVTAGGRLFGLSL
jgi:hypothetical protein